MNGKTQSPFTMVKGEKERTALFTFVRKGLALSTLGSVERQADLVAERVLEGCVPRYMC